MMNDKSIKSRARFDSGSYSRMQFLLAVSHSIGAHTEALQPTDVSSSSSSSSSGGEDEDSIRGFVNDMRYINSRFTYLLSDSRVNSDSDVDNVGIGSSRCSSPRRLLQRVLH